MPAREQTLSPALQAAVDATVTRMHTARREALAAYPADRQRWEYDGRMWYWPGGEELPYFFDLCAGEEEALSALETRFDLSRVGVGTGRVAIAVPESADYNAEEAERNSRGYGDRVIKLARAGPSAEMGDGRRQNQREQNLSASIGDHPFLPVLCGDEAGNWLVMPRAQVQRPDEPGTETALASVRNALRPYADRVHFDELKPENVGQWDGRNWLLDYGRPPETTPASGADQF